MSRLGAKLCRAYHTFFEGFQVPVGASYGRTRICGEEWFWTCTDYSGLTSGQLHIQFMKRSWMSNQNCRVNKLTWHKILIGKQHPIYAEIIALLQGRIPKIIGYEPPRKPKLPLNEKFSIGLKKSQGSYQYRAANVRSLGGDNADQSYPIKNQNSYWVNKHDVVRGSVNYGGNIF